MVEPDSDSFINSRCGITSEPDLSCQAGGILNLMLTFYSVFRER